jgi:hypothetical protein
VAMSTRGSAWTHGGIHRRRGEAQISGGHRKNRTAPPVAEGRHRKEDSHSPGVSTSRRSCPSSSSQIRATPGGSSAEPALPARCRRRR